MALQTNGDIITEFLVRNNRTTTDSFTSDVIVQGWLKDAYNWATAYKKWPFTEGRVSTTFVQVLNEDGYTTLSYPESFRSDSVRLLTIGGKRMQKKNFYKFQQFIEDNSNDTTKIWTDYGRQVYINPSAGDMSGTVVFWGQYQPLLDVTDMTALTVFSVYDEDANEAILEKMTSFLKRKEHQSFEEQVLGQTAAARLDALHLRIQEEQAQYQDTNNEGMFKRIDYVQGGFITDILRRDQF